MIHIKTEKSFISSKKFQDENIIKKSVEEIKNDLQRMPIVMFGKKLTQPRLIGFFSNESIGYKYSKQIINSQPLTVSLNSLLVNINNTFNSNFNGILVNKYVDGNDYICAHSDDEKGISNIGIVSISFGSKRKFRIRNKISKKIIIDIDMKSYDIIHMGGEFQNEFTHEIPKQKNIKEPRYSFTFRKHNI